MRRSKSSASSTNCAPGHELGAELGPEPARQAARGAGHRHTARIARQPAGLVVQPLVQALHRRRGVGPLLRREHARPRARTACARRRARRCRAPPQAAALRGSPDRAGAAVGGGAPADARGTRGRRPPATAATISSPVPNVLASRVALAGSTSPGRSRPRSPRSRPRPRPLRQARTPPRSGAPSGSVTDAVARSPSSARSSASSVPSPPSATGHRSTGPPRRLEPATDRVRDLGRGQRALERVWGDQHGGRDAGNVCHSSAVWSGIGKSGSMPHAGRMFVGRIPLGNPAR